MLHSGIILKIKMSYLRTCEVLPLVQNLINSINNVDEITGNIRTKLEEFYHHYSKILRNEKAGEIQNFEEDDFAEYYLPAGIFDEFFIPRYFIFFYFIVMLEISLRNCLRFDLNHNFPAKDAYWIPNFFSNFVDCLAHVYLLGTCEVTVRERNWLVVPEGHLRVIFFINSYFKPLHTLP